MTITVTPDFFASETGFNLADDTSMGPPLHLTPTGTYFDFDPGPFVETVEIACGVSHTFTISDAFQNGGPTYDLTTSVGYIILVAPVLMANGVSAESVTFTVPLALCSPSNGPSGHEDQQNGGTPLATQTTLSFTSTSAHKALINRLMRCRSDDVLDEEERRRRISSGEELDELDACPSFEDYPEQPRWNLWVNAGYTVIDGSSSSPDGGILNGVVGLDYKVNEDWVLGALAGYEWTDFDFARTNGTLEGGGFTLAAYTGLRLSRNLTIDALLGHSWLNYDNDVAGDSGDFDAKRWMLAGNITGHFLYGKYTIEPNLHGQIAWETQEGYTTSGNTFVAKQTLTIGKIAFGPRVSRDHLMENGTNAEFWGAVEGEYDFANTDVGTTNLNMDGDVSARLSAGVDFDFTNDVSLELDGNIGGLGAAGYTSYQGNVRVAVPF
ncbi:MAG: autotransporter outer membrane beta-barrel domain-containing protein [Hyphomicrobiales bacterium]